MVKQLNINSSFTSSNYYDFGNDTNKNNFESLNTYNMSLQTGKFTTTVGLGASTKFNTDTVFEESPFKRSFHLQWNDNVTRTSGSFLENLE